MDQQPDKLFRDKLRGYQKPVSDDAWNRVSENLRSERKKYPWLRIAAAVLLVAVAAILLFPFRKNDPSGTIAQDAQTLEQPGSTPPFLQEETDTDSGKTLSENKAKGYTAGENSDSRPASARQQRRHQTRAVSPVVRKEAETRTDVAFRNPVDIARDTASAHPEALRHETPVASKESPRRVTIVFSAEEVNDKYLDKKEMTDATPETKPASSIRKLLDKAYALKHNQDPLGELRQKKNEILAFNFKDDKPQHD